jgi:hypothetical protein
MLEAVRTSETSVYSKETTRRYIQEGSNLRSWMTPKFDGVDWSRVIVYSLKSDVAGLFVFRRVTSFCNSSTYRSIDDVRLKTAFLWWAVRDVEGKLASKVLQRCSCIVHMHFYRHTWLRWICCQGVCLHAQLALTSQSYYMYLGLRHSSGFDIWYS